MGLRLAGFLVWGVCGTGSGLSVVFGWWVLVGLYVWLAFKGVAGDDGWVFVWFRTGLTYAVSCGEF